MLAYNWNRIFAYVWTIVFMKDGLVTRQSVNSFDELYSLGSARRHECVMVHIFIWYILDCCAQSQKRNCISKK